MSAEGPPAVAIGDVLLDKYRVERVLGIGGMGAVLAVRHLELDQLFALKILLPQALRMQGGVDRFLREARAAARLTSDHVAKVHDVGRLKLGEPYMLMEYLRGRDLKEVLSQEGRLPLATAITYVLQALEAIGEAHAAGIVHRDLKPANLFLTAKPNGAPSIKVLDFGISKQASGDPKQLDMTATTALLGSPLYMSPEQMMSAKHVDIRTDIWALGVILHELVIGEAPFLGETITQLAGRVLNQEPTLPSVRRRDLPPALDAVVMRCLRKLPDERFANTAELGAALQSILAGGGAAQSSLAATTPLRPGFLPIPAPLGDATGSLGAPLPALAGSGSFNAPDGWGRTKQGSPLEGNRSRAALFAIAAILGIAASVAYILWGHRVEPAERSDSAVLTASAAQFAPRNDVSSRLIGSVPPFADPPARLPADNRSPSDLPTANPAASVSAIAPSSGPPPSASSKPPTNNAPQSAPHASSTPPAADPFGSGRK